MSFPPNPSEPPEDVYDAALAFADAQADAPHSPALLQEWLRAFPQFADALRAASWQMEVQGPSWLTEDDAAADADKDAEDAQIVAAGQSVLASLLPPQTARPPLSSLLTAAELLGLTAQAFAQTLGVDVPLLARLEQRLLRVPTLPRRLVQQIAHTLHYSAADVAAFLRAGPTLAASAHYKSRQAPRVGGQISFADALAQSSPDTQRAWQDDTDLLGETDL